MKTKTPQELGEKTMSNIHNILTRIRINEGYVDNIDCMRLVSLYTEIYGEKYTKLDREYEMIYYLDMLMKYYLENKIRRNDR